MQTFSQGRLIWFVPQSPLVMTLTGIYNAHVHINIPGENKWTKLTQIPDRREQKCSFPSRPLWHPRFPDLCQQEEPEKSDSENLRVSFVLISGLWSGFSRHMMLSITSGWSLKKSLHYRIPRDIPDNSSILWAQPNPCAMPELFALFRFYWKTIILKFKEKYSN